MSMSAPTAQLLSAFFSDTQWRLPLSLAISVHIITFLLLIFPPMFFLRDKNITEIQTISLFTVDELHKATQSPKPKPAKPEPSKPAPAENNAKSIALENQPAPAPPAQVISLRPRRMKKKMVQEPKPPPTPTKEETLRQNALDRIQARVNQKKEDEKLKHDLSSLRDSLHTNANSSEQNQPEDTVSTEQEQHATGSSQGTDARINEAQRRYFIAVQRRILDNWALPKSQDWDNTLESIIVIYIEKTGVISRTIFEKKSKNVYFNQYVEKTIQAASPMPPIPSALKQNRLEIGLRFRPSGLF